MTDWSQLSRALHGLIGGGKELAESAIAGHTYKEASEQLKSDWYKYVTENNKILGMQEPNQDAQVNTDPNSTVQLRQPTTATKDSYYSDMISHLSNNIMKMEGLGTKQGNVAAGTISTMYSLLTKSKPEVNWVIKTDNEGNLIRINPDTGGYSIIKKAEATTKEVKDKSSYGDEYLRDGAVYQDRYDENGKWLESVKIRDANDYDLKNLSDEEKITSGVKRRGSGLRSGRKTKDTTEKEYAHDFDRRRQDHQKLTPKYDTEKGEYTNPADILNNEVESLKNKFQQIIDEGEHQDLSKEEISAKINELIKQYDKNGTYTRKALAIVIGMLNETGY